MPTKLAELWKLIQSIASDPSLASIGFALAGAYSRFKAAKTTQDKASAIFDGLKAITGKTPTTVDDDLIELIAAMFESPAVVAGFEKLMAHFFPVAA